MAGCPTEALREADSLATPRWAGTFVWGVSASAPGSHVGIKRRHFRRGHKDPDLGADSAMGKVAGPESERRQRACSPGKGFGVCSGETFYRYHSGHRVESGPGDTSRKRVGRLRV